MKAPAVVLGGAANAVSVARSLGAAGIAVHAVGHGDSPVRYSRHCAGFADLGKDGDVQARWLAWLVSDAPAGAAVLPCDDDGVELVARHRAALLAAGLLVVEADDDVMLAMLDKDRTYALARAAGIPSPATFAVRTHADVASVLETAGFPCALKPVHAHLFRRALQTNAKALTVHDRAELEEALTRLVEEDVEMLVTEVIPGDEDQFAGYYSYLDADGEPLFHFTKQKIRQNPPVFGEGSYHVTTWDPEVAELGLRFFQAMGVRGMANVEFKRDEHTSEWKLIECNHRFTAINELVRIAGLDLALFAYNRLVGAPGPELERYRVGVRIWLPLADLRAFLTLRRSGDLTTGEWVRSVWHRQNVPMFRREDPAPSLRRAAMRVRGAGPKLLALARD